MKIRFHVKFEHVVRATLCLNELFRITEVSEELADKLRPASTQTTKVNSLLTSGSDKLIAVSKCLQNFMVKIAPAGATSQVAVYLAIAYASEKKTLGFHANVVHLRGLDVHRFLQKPMDACGPVRVIPVVQSVAIEGISSCNTAAVSRL